MSQFLSREAERLSPYTPGEQPRNRKLIKLNTNESPFPPAPGVLKAVAGETDLNLYSDPACQVLNDAIARRNGLKPENVISGNGSDELLAFAFRAFCGEGKPVAYPDITYGFYKSQVALFGLEAKQIPLREDLSLAVEDYMDFSGTIVIANPNAPTGKAIPVSDIERLLQKDPDRVVLVDEAYVDFGGESCVPLIHRFPNLLVVQTMSKSRSLAGGRIGFAMGSEALISDLNRVKYSFNPYNVNRLSLLAGAAAIKDEQYFKTACAHIQQNREWTVEELRGLGFHVLDSQTNFIFAESDKITGQRLYEALKEAGILVRWFNEDRIRNFVRITIGSIDQMAILAAELEQILTDQ